MTESVVIEKMNVAATDQQAEVTDKQVEVTDKQVEVTDKQVEATDKQVEVTDKQVEATDKQVEVTDKQAEVTDKQVEVTDKQVEVTDKQVEVTDKQVEVTDKQVDVTDKQVEVTDKQVEVTDKQVEVTDKQVEVTDKQVEVTDKQVEVAEKQVNVEEVCRIRLHAQDRYDVMGMVVYHQYVYVVHDTGLIVYCYTPDGSFSHQYEHEGGSDDGASGMCLTMDGDAARLVVSNGTTKALFWITIIEAVTVELHRTNQLNYKPSATYNDINDLMVCDHKNHKIHRYRYGGQALAVINLPDNVWPSCVVRHGDDDQYVVSDWRDYPVIIDNKGQVKARYLDYIHGVKLGVPCETIIDPHRGILIADELNSQVLLLRRTGNVEKILYKYVISPKSLYLDTDHHRLYVCGTNVHDDEDV